MCLLDLVFYDVEEGGKQTENKRFSFTFNVKVLSFTLLTSGFQTFYTQLNCHFS